MNELNYASLEAAQKLISNGIVLKASFYWRVWSGLTIRHIADNGAEIVSKKEKESLQDPTSETSDNKRYDVRYYPAPCFTDVWRELPEEYDTETRHLELQVDKIKRVDGVIVTSANYIYNDAESGCCVYKFFTKENPTDALIDLLVWLKGEGK